VSEKASRGLCHEIARIFSPEGWMSSSKVRPLLLPATLQFLIVMIASAINDRMQRKLGESCRLVSGLTTYGSS
jgi:hypothetical protein